MEFAHLGNCLINYRKKEKFDYLSIMKSQQKKIEDIYYDKYIEGSLVSDKIKKKLESIEKKLDALDETLNGLKEIDKLSGRLVDDINKLDKEKWNDLSLEMILKDSGMFFYLN